MLLLMWVVLFANIVAMALLSLNAERSGAYILTAFYNGVGSYLTYILIMSIFFGKIT
jgi:hypothetical protein